MATTIDYLKWRDDISFDLKPVNEVDRMIFTCLGKLNYSGLFITDDEILPIADLYARYKTKAADDRKNGLLESPGLMQIMEELCGSDRYKDVKVCEYVNIVDQEASEQFSALTVLGPSGEVYVTFRGTDDNIVGWKENCELAILDVVPAQRDALKYLEKIAARFDGSIYVSGHSKGGNLAVYAASKAGTRIQSRIAKVMSYDGPGFELKFLLGDGYQKIKDKIITYVPKYSIVGMLMQHAGTMCVIDTDKEGALAHDSFLWNLDRAGFSVVPDLSKKSISFRNAFEDLMNDMSIDDRREFVDELFSVLTSTGATSLNEISEQPLAKDIEMLSSLKQKNAIAKFIILLSGFSIKENLKLSLQKLIR